MAKKQKVNRSELVREFYRANPGASAGTALQAMAKKGHKVSIALCSQIRSKMGGGGRRKTTKKKKVVRVKTTIATVSTNSLSAADLYAAKDLVDRVGGIDKARQALEALEALQ